MLRNLYTHGALKALRHANQLKPAAILCVALFQCSFISFGYAQGLLGKPFVRAGFSMSSPDDPLLKEIYDWGYGIDLVGNLPINDTIDLRFDFDAAWADGEIDTTSGPVTSEFDIKSLNFTVVKHFFPNEQFDPFVAIGAGFQTADFEISSTTETVAFDETDSGVYWVSGFEWKIGEQVAIRPQMGTGSSFENFEASHFIEDLFFETEFICWLTEEVFTGFSVGSDFDDTEIELGFFIGVGQW